MESAAIRGLTDGGGQQVRADDVAGDEVPGPVRHLVELVGVDQARAVVEVLETGQVTALADGRDDEVRRRAPARCPRPGSGAAVGHRAVGNLERRWRGRRRP